MDVATLKQPETAVAPRAGHPAKEETMNHLVIKRALLGCGVVALFATAGAQLYLTHALVQHLDAAAAAQAQVQAAMPPTALAQDPVVPPLAAIDPHSPQYDPWTVMDAEMARMKAHMHQLFQGVDQGGGSAAAQVTLKDAGDAYVVKAQIPGVAQNDVKVHLDGQRLTITAKGQVQGQDPHGQTHYASAFQQDFTLPGPVDAAKMHDQFDAGQLTITIPKAG